MFTGEYEYTIDEKGRVPIHPSFRDELGTTVRVGRGSQGQVNIYPIPLWEQMVAAMRATPETRVTHEDAYRYVFAAVECDVDRQGRLLVPPSLRRFGELSGEVIVNGNDDRVEVWSQARFEKNSADYSRQNAPRDDPQTRLRAGVSM
jgi:MraZ protein